MGVGPPGRTGRDQLADVKLFIARMPPEAAGVALVACGRGAGGITTEPSFLDAPVYEVSCAGTLHTSVVEYLIRAGWGGVLIVSCPPRDCWNREGATWLEQRIHHGREAELKERVERRRVRIAWAGAAEPLLVAAELQAFRAEVAALAHAVAAERDIDMEALCEVPEVSVAEEAIR